MLERLSCVYVDWSAISAVAKAAACFVALYVASREGWRHKRIQKKILRRTLYLTQMEVALLEALHKLMIEAKKQNLSLQSAPPEHFEALRKLMAIPNLRATLQEVEHLPDGLLKRISAVVFVLDGFEALIVGESWLSMSDETWDSDALRSAIDNLKTELNGLSLS